MIWMKQSKGIVLSINPSPASMEETVISPVDFLMIVFMSTELGTYSRISMMMCGMDFSISLFPGMLNGGPDSFTSKGEPIWGTNHYRITR